VYRCDGCGFEHTLKDADHARFEIVNGAYELASALLDFEDDEARARPDPATWSPLEYACHVRDVFLVQRERIYLARVQDQPETVPMFRDERVGFDGYDEQDPMDVATQLEHAATLFSNALRRLSPADWERTVVYGFPERSVRSLRWVAIHTWHEVVHHLGDLLRQRDG
jgi:hypothetical protein